MNARDGKRAVVLSGGGADGAYAVGVLKALFGGRSPATNFEPLHPDVFAGTSIGCFNAAFLASQWDERGPAAIANLEAIWLERLAVRPGSCGNGVFRIRGNPVDFFNPACYASNPLAPFRQLFTDAAVLGLEVLQRTVHGATIQDVPLVDRTVPFVSLVPFVDTERLRRLLREVIDYRALRATSRILRIVAVNWSTGDLRDFGNQDMTEITGPAAIAASAAIPGFFPPVTIGAQPYVDGSVLMNTPLKPAIRAGANDLHVVYLDPDVRSIPLAEIQSFPETYRRMQQIAWARSVNQDIKRAERINDGLATIRKTRNVGAEGLTNFVEVADTVRRHFAGKERPLRPLSICRYRPRDILSQGLGFLNFGRDHIEALIDRGFDDAVHHDHQLSEDVHPGVHPEDPEAASVTDGDASATNS